MSRAKTQVGTGRSFRVSFKAFSPVVEVSKTDVYRGRQRRNKKDGGNKKATKEATYKRWTGRSWTKRVLESCMAIVASRSICCACSATGIAPTALSEGIDKVDDRKWPVLWHRRERISSRKRDRINAY